MGRDKKEQQSWQSSLLLSLPLVSLIVRGYRQSGPLAHVSPGRLMNDPQSCWLYPEQPAMYRRSDQPSIYNHIKTPRRPWLCVVASWIQTSWMFGAVVERGNVATGHQIMKKWLCCQVPHVRVFLHRVCVVAVCVHVRSSIVSQGTLT